MYRDGDDCDPDKEHDSDTLGDVVRAVAELVQDESACDGCDGAVFGPASGVTIK